MANRAFGTEKGNATLVLALSGAVTVLVAGGNGPPSLGRMVSRVLSNPIPKRAAGARSPAPAS